MAAVFLGNVCGRISSACRSGLHQLLGEQFDELVVILLVDVDFIVEAAQFLAI